MSEYKCFDCKKIIKPEHIRRRVRCIYCGSKLIFKPREKPSKIKAR
jgi:DNA-directed RNA polymerase subunit RPC12/RpoP